MRYLLLAIMLAYSLPAFSEKNQLKYMESNKLGISVTTHDGKPESWLRFYGQTEPKKEKRITITANFDMDHVHKILITDMNAVNNICGPQQREKILLLIFDPEKNMKEITTQIDKPCFDKRNAVFRLRIVTGNNKRYENITTLTAHPDAFRSWSSPSDL